MSRETAEKRIQDMNVDRWGSESSKFCLVQVKNFQTDNGKVLEKIDDLVASVSDETKKGHVEIACNIGGCTLKIAESNTEGRTTTGECKAASYCLKVCFEAVGNSSNVEDGGALYRDVMDTCDGFAGKYSAGNFCPKLDCELSAGLSIDMVPGTAGDCIDEIRGPQLPLDLSAHNS
jgi:hypothetical protein